MEGTRGGRKHKETRREQKETGRLYEEEWNQVAMITFVIEDTGVAEYTGSPGCPHQQLEEKTYERFYGEHCHRWAAVEDTR